MSRLSYERQDDPLDHLYDEDRSLPRAITSAHRRKSVKDSKKRPVFTRGYDESRDKLNSNPYYLRSCFNCAYYYQASGDTEEMCQNEDVLQYDLVQEGHNVYCLKWVSSSAKKSDQQRMFKSGRSKLDY